MIIFLSFTLLAAFNAYDEAKEMAEFTRRREMPALGIAALSRLNNTAAFYKRAGEKLLKNDFIRNWIIDGEGDVDQLMAFMKSIRDENGLLDSSLVSDITETYYGTDGRVLQLSPELETRDGWYYHYRESVTGSNIDSWYYPETGIVGLFVNVPVRDSDGRYIGVTGGGVDSKIFTSILLSIEEKWDIGVHMFRTDGRLVYSTDKSYLKPPVRTVDSLWKKPVLDKLCREKNNPAGVVLEPDGRNGAVLWGGYMPDWETYLIIERSGQAMDEAVYRAVIGSLVSGGVLSLILIILTLGVLRLFSSSTSETVNTSRKFVHRLQSVVYFQDKLLESAAEDLNSLKGTDSGRSLDSARSSLKLVTSADYDGLKHLRVNMNDMIHDVLLKKRITAVTKFIARNFIIEGDDSLLELLLSEVLSIITGCAESLSGMLLITGNFSGNLSVDFIFDLRSGADEPDFTIIGPLLEILGAQLEIEKPAGKKRIIRLNFQLLGE